MNRSFESNGPDVKVRGTASHIHEKYLSLARDATVSGDRVQAENYFQHAEHYYRIVAAAQAQQQANQAQQQPQQTPRDEGEQQAQPAAPPAQAEPANGNGHSAPAATVPPPDGGEQPEIAFPEEATPPPPSAPSRRRSRGPKAGSPADLVAQVEANAEAATDEKPRRTRAPKRNGESPDMAPAVEAEVGDAPPAGC